MLSRWRIWHLYINLARTPQFSAKLLNRNCYRLSRVSWALAQISCFILLQHERQAYKIKCMCESRWWTLPSSHHHCEVACCVVQIRVCFSTVQTWCHRRNGWRRCSHVNRTDAAFSAVQLQRLECLVLRSAHIIQTHKRCTPHLFTHTLRHSRTPAMAAPAFYEWRGQGGQDMCKGGHTFFISYFNPPPSLSSLHPGYHPIHTSRVTTFRSR